MAQTANIADDHRQLQGIWRVSSVMSRSQEVREFASGLRLLIDGDRLWLGFPFPEYKFSIDASKHAKQIDLTPILPPPDYPAQKAAPRAEAKVCGIYELEKDRLKLRIDRAAKGRGRPILCCTEPGQRTLC